MSPRHRSRSWSRHRSADRRDARRPDRILSPIRRHDDKDLEKQRVRGSETSSCGTGFTPRDLRCKSQGGAGPGHRFPDHHQHHSNHFAKTDSSSHRKQEFQRETDRRPVITHTRSVNPWYGPKNPIANLPPKVQDEVRQRQAERRRFVRELEDVESVMEQEMIESHQQVGQPIVARSPDKENYNPKRMEFARGMSLEQLTQFYLVKEKEMEEDEKRNQELWELNIQNRLQNLHGSEAAATRRFFESQNNREKLKWNGLSFKKTLPEAMREIVRLETDREYAKEVKLAEEERHRVMREEVLEAFNVKQANKNPESRRLLYSHDKGFSLASKDAEQRQLNKDISSFMGGCAIPGNGNESDDDDDEDFLSLSRRSRTLI